MSSYSLYAQLFNRCSCFPLYSRYQNVGTQTILHRTWTYHGDNGPHWTPICPEHLHHNALCESMKDLHILHTSELDSWVDFQRPSSSDPSLCSSLSAHLCLYTSLPWSPPVLPTQLVVLKLIGLLTLQTQFITAVQEHLPDWCSSPS